MKPNETAGYDNINVNVINKTYEELKTLSCVNTRIFPDKLKIGKVSPILKNGEKDLLTNFRPMSFLSCFSKILERIMYDRIYTHFTENKVIFEKQFGFRAGRSTNHDV